MSDFWEHAVNFYHMRLVPTVKRMLDRRRFLYTLLTVAVLLVSAAVLSLLVCYTADILLSHSRLEADYQAYLTKFVTGGGRRSPMPELTQLLAMARGERIATAILCGALWLILSVLAIGRIMTSVMDSEAYVYGLYMIYGADRKQLSRQLSVEFLLAGIPAAAAGLPAGFAVYRTIGGTADFPFRSLWITVPAFLLLILVCASVLAGRLLNRSCVQLLRAADTAVETVSPRRSNLAGLTGRRSTLSSASLAVWRMRRHYASVAALNLVIVALIFGILSPLEPVRQAPAPAFTLRFPEGIHSDTLEADYVYSLREQAGVTGLDYRAADAADALGTHILSDHPGLSENGIPLGERYATSSLRIACGDGDTFSELGGRVTIPEDALHLAIPSPSDFGYRLDAVPVGCAVYVYPEGTVPPLSLHAGDTVRLYLPSGDVSADSDSSEPSGEYRTVRIISVVAVNSIYAERGGPEICPRITEDYLYLNPLDYEKFDGRTHASAFVANEAFPSDIALPEEGGSCILAVPASYWQGIPVPTHVTVVLPEAPIREAFRNSTDKISLPTDTYFINHTAKAVGIYLGPQKEYLADYEAAAALYKHVKPLIAQYVGTTMPATVTKEYQVDRIIYTEETGKPYLILPRGEDVTYSALQNDLCAFRLDTVSGNSPKLRYIAEEAYLVETDSLMGASYFGRICYLGTTLVPEFVAAMEARGLPLQLAENSFSHTKTVIRNSFTQGNLSFLLTEPYPYGIETLQADSYPRLVSGAGSFCNLGNTDEISILDAAERGITALVDGDAIGQLKDQSVLVPGEYAYGRILLSPLGEALPGQNLASGRGIYVTDGSAADCPVQPGDILSVAIREDTAWLMNDPQFMTLAGDQPRLLAYLLEKIPYGYMEITVDKVIEGDESALVLTEEDLSAVLGQSALYTRLDLYLSPDIGVESYMNLHTAINRILKQNGSGGIKEYDRDFIIEAGIGQEVRDSVLSFTGYLAACILPLLLLAAQLVFMEKRREEMNILHAIGHTPGMRRGQFAAETGIWAALMAVTTAVACPVGHILSLILSDLVGATVSDAPIDLPLCGGLVLTVTLSCLVTGILAYGRMTRGRSYRPQAGKARKFRPQSTETEVMP